MLAACPLPACLLFPQWGGGGQRAGMEDRRLWELQLWNVDTAAFS